MSVQVKSISSAKSGTDLMWDTPVPVVDLDVMERNIAALQQACDAAGVLNRPHIKTHKSIEIAKLQLAAGATGITCQKLGEAEVMADGGIDDILISYNIIGAAKHERLAALNARVSLMVSCDNEIVAQDLSHAIASGKRDITVLVEADTGRHRCGVTTPEAAVELAVLINSLPGLQFGGLLMYPPDGQHEQAVAFLDAARAGCEKHGLTISIVSSGGSPNIACIGQLGATEFRSGTSIFNDRKMVDLGAASYDDCALHIYATVVSHPETGRIMLDAGSKALSSDLSGFKDFGLLPEYPQARIVQFAEEHGFVDVSRCQTIPKIGEIVRVLPNHVCPTINLSEDIAKLRGGKHVGSFSVDARGKVR